MAIRFVSFTPSASVSSAAPNVSSFTAGKRNDDGTYSAVMQWDAFGSSFLVQFRCISAVSTDSPAASNFRGVKIAITPPDSPVPQVATPACEPFAPDGLGNYVYEGQLTIDAAMFGGSIPAVPVNLIFTAVSINSADVPNLDVNGYPTGPAVTLATLDPATAPIVTTTPPSQPASVTASVIATGYNEAAGQPLAELQISVPNSSGASYYSVWQYAGASAPSDPSAWGSPVLNVAAASSSPTLGQWWTARSFSAAITLWLRVRASSASYTAGVTDSGPADISVVVSQVGVPAQPTGFSATLYTSNQGGVTCGAFACSWTQPADIEYFSANVYAIQTDAAYTPLSGATWVQIGSATSGFDQRKMTPPQWWPMGAEGWVTLKVQSVGRAIDPSTGKNVENATSAPTANLHVTASPGIDTTKLATPVQGSQLASGIIDSLSYFGSSSVRPLAVVSSLPALPNANYPVGAMVVNSTDGKPYRNVAGVWSAGTAAGDITAGTLVAGVVYAGAVAVSQLTAGTATFTSDVLFYRTATNYVGINSTGVNIVGSGNQVALTSAGILIQQNGSSGPYVQITSGGVSLVNQSGQVVSVSGGVISLQDVSTGSAMTLQSTGVVIQQGSSGGKVSLTSSGLTIKGSVSGSYNTVIISSNGDATFNDEYGNQTIIGGSGVPGIRCNGTIKSTGLIVNANTGATETVDVSVPGGGTWRLFYDGGCYYGHSVIS